MRAIPFTFLLLLVTAVIVFTVADKSQAQTTVPSAISYQGFLSDASGSPINGQFPMVFGFYEDADALAPLWQESHSTVAVLGGFFQVELGLEELLDDSLFEGALYLGISIDGDPEITPRTAIYSVPYARRAGGLLACTSGETNCFGTCADLQLDLQHCGLCGQACTESEVCESGSCTECIAQTFYLDADQDGWGKCSDSIQACEPSGSYTALECGDCDDDNPDIHPGAEEFCNALDNNCDGQVDEGAEASCPDSGNDCTLPVCDSGMCDTAFEPNGKSCADGTGACNGSGTCITF